MGRVPQDGHPTANTHGIEADTRQSARHIGTASVKGPSPEVLELLLDDERLDVDPRNKLDGETPLHLAVKIEDPQARSWTVITLLDAGADPSIQNKHRDKAEELLPKDSPLHDDLWVAGCNARAFSERADALTLDDDTSAHSLRIRVSFHAAGEQKQMLH